MQIVFSGHMTGPAKGDLVEAEIGPAHRFAAASARRLPVVGPAGRPDPAASGKRGPRSTTPLAVDDAEGFPAIGREGHQFHEPLPSDFASGRASPARTRAPRPRWRAIRGSAPRRARPSLRSTLSSGSRLGALPDPAPDDAVFHRDQPGRADQVALVDARFALGRAVARAAEDPPGEFAGIRARSATQIRSAIEFSVCCSTKLGKTLWIASVVPQSNSGQPRTIRADRRCRSRRPPRAVCPGRIRAPRGRSRRSSS